MERNYLEPWVFPQLERLAMLRPARVEQLILKLLEAEPTLKRELTIMAVEEGLLASGDAAAILHETEEAVKADAAKMRETLERESSHSLIAKDKKGVAKLTGKHVAVWEIVREYRIAGSVEQVCQMFQTLSEWDVRAALSYAGRNPDEIGAQMREYEEHLERARAAYPFAKVN